MILMKLNDEGQDILAGKLDPVPQQVTPHATAIVQADPRKSRLHLVERACRGASGTAAPTAVASSQAKRVAR
jgi:hypothetical protein